MRRRFFVDKFSDNRAAVEGETAHHLGRVLRAQEGQLYELSDGRTAWLGRIERATKDRVEFALVEEIPALEPRLEVSLLLSIAKFDGFEWALEKATELGVATILPLAAARSDKALISAARKRSERWSKILLEASQQSRRLRVPVLQEATGPEQAFQSCNADAKILFSERAGAPPLRQTVATLREPRTVALAIGPEGGWTEDEFGAAHAAGFREASLGKLILRVETAVIAALASLNYAWEA